MVPERLPRCISLARGVLYKSYSPSTFGVQTSGQASFVERGVFLKAFLCSLRIWGGFPHLSHTTNCKLHAQSGRKLLKRFVWLQMVRDQCSAARGTLGQVAVG